MTIRPTRPTTLGPLALVLMTWVLLPPAPARAACPPAGDCAVPGGGSVNTDCIVEYFGFVLNDPLSEPRRVTCTDGDLACDVDGLANGACSFRVGACINNPDTRFPTCPAPGSGALTSYVVQNKPPGHKRFDPELDAINDAVNAFLPSSAPACTGLNTIKIMLKVKQGTFRKNRKRIRGTATMANPLVADRDTIRFTCLPSPTFPSPTTTYARATVIAQPAQLIEGPLARGQIGDILLQNDEIQVVIQQPGRVFFGIGTYGGNIIDADLARCDAERDHFEEWIPGINIENTANYTNVMVLNDGTNSLPAVVRATGPDDLFDFINPSSVVTSFNPTLTFPAAADDQDLPVTVQTDYTLEGGKRYVKVDTTLTNTSGTPKTIFFNDYLNGSGEVEMWQAGYGFGEPLVTDPCALTALSGGIDTCNVLAFSGDEGAAGVSYGYIHSESSNSCAAAPLFANGCGSTSFAQSGVVVPILGRQAVQVLIGLQGENFTLPGAGSLTFTRYFAVGDGSVASIRDIRNGIFAVTTGTVIGSVTAGGLPVANADVAVLGTSGGRSGAALNVVSHFRTAADGTYTGTLEPGSYNLRVNKDGRLAATPNPAPVTITSGGTTTQNFTIPAPGRLQVTVNDVTSGSPVPIPAKVQLVGIDPTPELFNTDAVLIVNIRTSVFGDTEDDLPHGISFATFPDRTGDTGEVEVEPGTYQLAVSHGPRYSHSTQTVVITSGALTTATAELARVVPTPNFVSGDFHVHSINSPDCEVTNAERVATELAEGMDFFTPSDHEFRADFGPTIAAMGVSDLISTAQSAEITTFDYGHFNSWPVAHDPGALHGGGIDWGRELVPVGMDFPTIIPPSYGLSPAEIYAAAHLDTPGNLIQINHIASHFGPDGLEIDTAQTPPQSNTPALARRLDPGITNHFDDGFDALEVWIGTDGRSGDLNTFIGLNLGDWFNMLNQGILKAGVADSDTHQRRTTQINARTYIPSSVTDPGMLGPEAFNLAAAVKAGRTTGTNGPFITVTATTLSESGGPDLTNLVSTPDGNVDITVDVKSPLWAEFDEIEFYINNAPQAFNHDGFPQTINRYRVFADISKVKGTDFTISSMTDFPAIPGGQGGHLETSYTLSMNFLQDAWVVVLVRGNDNVTCPGCPLAQLSKPLFPVIPNSLKVSGNSNLAQLTDGNLNEDGVLALAFSNPILIDADNDNVWTPPGVMLTP